MNAATILHSRKGNLAITTPRMTCSLLLRVALSTYQALATSGHQGPIQEYGWYRQFESHRPNPHQCKKQSSNIRKKSSSNIR